MVLGGCRSFLLLVTTLELQYIRSELQLILLSVRVKFLNKETLLTYSSKMIYLLV